MCCAHVIFAENVQTHLLSEYELLPVHLSIRNPETVTFVVGNPKAEKAVRLVLGYKEGEELYVV